jgi:hypothetical protein
METPIMDSDLEARIRIRAYYLWLNDPSPQGKAEEHWEEARRQIETEGDFAQEGAAPNVDQSADSESGECPAPGEQVQEIRGSVQTQDRSGQRQRA